MNAELWAFAASQLVVLAGFVLGICIAHAAFWWFVTRDRHPRTTRQSRRRAHLRYMLASCIASDRQEQGRDWEHLRPVMARALEHAFSPADGGPR